MVLAGADDAVDTAAAGNACKAKIMCVTSMEALEKRAGGEDQPSIM